MKFDVILTKTCFKLVKAFFRSAEEPCRKKALFRQTEAPVAIWCGENGRHFAGSVPSIF
jgi:hypothetical protein